MQIIEYTSLFIWRFWVYCVDVQFSYVILGRKCLGFGQKDEFFLQNVNLLYLPFSDTISFISIYVYNNNICSINLQTIPIYESVISKIIYRNCPVDVLWNFICLHWFIHIFLCVPQGNLKELCIIRITKKTSRYKELIK